MARSRGSNSTLALSFESIYGTVPSSGWASLPASSWNIGEEQGYIANDLVGLGREPLDPTRDVVNNDGTFTVPVDLQNFGYWLKLMLGQDTAVNNTGVYTHTFTSGAAVLPSASIEAGNPEVPSYSQNYGIMGNTMRIGLARSGLLAAAVGVYGQGENLLTSSAATSPTSKPVTRFPQFIGNITVDGAVAGNIESAEFTINNNLDKVAVIRSDGRIAGADPGNFEVTGQIATLFQDTGLLNKASSGAATALTFGWSLGAETSLLFTLPRVFLPKVQRPVTGPAGIRATFPFQSSRDTGTGHALTAVLVNGVAAY